MTLKKKSLNTIIGNFVICFLWFLFATSLITSFILWLHAKSPLSIISGIICACGILFNIYLGKRAKADKSVKNKD
ncbi:hypothetical protein NIE88_21315 [Sporolactobacillus shoreicorticis]|uniref:Uncharacterized protein n=1 Tax=Sporolactobacillus shoreicorticis TaxID=1923877 RepID=A0ABW5S7S5_9BACL|nr:hypothetical protein [Sporolactobacillus shoreicorticis]MCO7128269.1 hypothetical protein [Sporolactobacillus shoreicorticis]